VAGARRTDVKYRELTGDDEIGQIIEELRVNHRDLSQVLPAHEYESTMGGRKVVTVYYRLEPALKVEAEEDLLNRFVSRLKETVQSYSSSSGN
jgi:hypothetical protein